MAPDLKKHFDRRSRIDCDRNFVFLEQIPYIGKYEEQKRKWTQEGNYAIAHFLDQTDLEIFLNAYIARALDMEGGYREKQDWLEEHKNEFPVTFRENGQQGEKTLRVPLHFLNTDTLINMIRKSHDIDPITVQERPYL